MREGGCLSLLFFRSAKLLRIPQIAKSFIPEMEVGGGVGCWKPDWEIVGNVIPQRMKGCPWAGSGMKDS